MKSAGKTLFYLLSGLAVLLVLAYLVSRLTDSLQVKEFTASLGLWGYLFLVTGVVLGGVLVPLSSLPFLLAGLVLYGFWPTFLLYYLGNTIIAPIIDFWLARRYGRPLVIKLTGQRTMTKIDQLTQITGRKALAILRIFGGILFDSISYAVGLTDMDFKSYLTLTATLPIPGMLLVLYALQLSLAGKPLLLTIVVIKGYLIGALTFYYLYRQSKTKNKEIRR